MTMREDNTIIEFAQYGRFVRVAAMDPKTLTEVRIVGDPKQSDGELRELALRKLRYVKQRNAKQAQNKSGRRGLVV